MKRSSLFGLLGAVLLVLTLAAVPFAHFFLAAPHADPAAVGHEH